MFFQHPVYIFEGFSQRIGIPIDQVLIHWQISVVDVSLAGSYFILLYILHSRLSILVDFS